MSKRRSKTYRIAAIALLFALLAWIAVHLSESDRSGDLPEPSESPATAGASYFDLLRSAREHVRSSSGHYAAEYDRLIDAGEPDELIRFIRTRFIVVPGGQNTGWNDAIRVRRWGAEATLRGGAGTPRELADLLADGIRRMGYEAVVVVIDSPLPRRDFSLREPPALIEFDNEALRDAFLASPLAAPGPMPDSDSFWQTAYATIPPEDIDVETFDSSASRFPSVRFARDGVSRVANLWAENPELTVDTPATIAPAGSDAPIVRISLQVAMAGAPDEPISVAEARWSSDAIAGRQISAAFAPVSRGAEELLTTPPRDFTSFVPTLQVHAPGVPAARLPAAVSGTPFSINGAIYTEIAEAWLPDSGHVRTGGDPAEVDSLRIRGVQTSNYPWIAVDFDALDAGGESVAGVPLDAFMATVDGEGTPMLMESNRSGDPKILFLLDVSASVAEELRGSAAAEFVQTIANDVEASSPASQFRIGFVSGSGASLLNWRDSPEELAGDMHHFGQGSPLWRAAGKVAETDASLVVFVTDGHAADRSGDIPEPDPASERSLLAGPPFVMVGAVMPGNEPGPAVQAIADLSQGSVVEMGDPADVAAAVIDAISARRAPYRVWLSASEEDREHHMTMALRDNDVTASTTFLAPSPEMRSPMPGPVGLYLVVEANGVRSARTLAGHAYRSRLPVSNLDHENAWLGLFGEYTLFAEAGTPNPAQILDDLISARLSWEPVILAEELDEAMHALGRVQRMPRSAFTFSAPLPADLESSDDGRVIDYGMRWWLHASQRVRQGDKEYHQQSTDLLPNTRFFSTHTDPRNAFANTFRASAYLSDLESSLYDLHALERLGDESLRYSGRRVRAGASEAESAAFAELTSGWPYPHRFIVPSDTPADAGVAVDITTGTAIGLLRGTGSANKGAGITEAEVDERFDLVGRLLSAATELGGGPAAWATLEQAKMDKLHFATILILRMEPPDLLGMLREHACDAASGAVDSAAEAGIRAATGRIGGELLDALSDYNDTAELLGMGGIDTSIPLPGCE